MKKWKGLQRICEPRGVSLRTTSASSVPSNELPAVPGWYIASSIEALARAPHGILAVEVAGTRLALFRTESGSIGCVEDRCCHRNVPLSLGRMEGERIVCAYHGWEFASDGVCVRIPSNLADSRIPRAAFVRRFEVVTHASYCWVWSGSHEPKAFLGSATLLDDFDSAPEHESRSTAVVQTDYRGLLMHHVDRLSHVTPGLLGAVPPRSIGVLRVVERDRSLQWTIEVASGECDGEGPIDPNGQPELAVEMVLPNALRVTRPRRGQGMIVRHFVPTDDGACRVETIVQSGDPDNDEATILPENLRSERLGIMVDRMIRIGSAGPRVPADGVVDAAERLLGTPWPSTATAVAAERSYRVRIPDV